MFDFKWHCYIHDLFLFSAKRNFDSMFNYSFVVLNTIIQTIDRMMIYQQNMNGSLFEKTKKQTKYNYQLISLKTYSKEAK
jgi:hypothetical protein